MMTHRLRNPRYQKRDTYTYSRQSIHHSSVYSPHSHRPSHRASLLSPYTHRTSQSSPPNHTSIDHSALQPNSPVLPQSSPDHRAHRHASRHELHQDHAIRSMTINISTALRRWLLEKGLEGYIKVAEAPPHPDAFNIARKLNVDTVTNAMVRQKLGLSGLGEKQFDIAPAETLRKYFAEYSLTAKAYRTKEIPNAFFREVAKFLLEVGCVHVNAYGMPKQKAGVVIETFEGKAVDWGVITGPTLREGLHSYQSGKKL